MKEILFSIIDKTLSVVIPLFLIYYFLPKFRKKLKDSDINNIDIDKQKKIIDEIVRYIENTSTNGISRKEKKEKVYNMAIKLLEKQNCKCDDELLDILIESSLSIFKND